MPRGSIPGRMRALQITELVRPRVALELERRPRARARAHDDRPARASSSTSQAAGVSFPEVLQTRGEYQVKPPTCRSCPAARSRAWSAARPTARASKPGDRVAAFCMLGGFAEVAVAPDVPDLQAARRARLRAGRGADPQLPHGLLRAEAARAAGSRARPCSSTAPPAASARRRSRSPRGWARARSRVVSSDEKEQRRARGGRRRGAALRRPVEGPGEGASGGGVDVVLDPVGGDRFTDSLRSLGEGGRARRRRLHRRLDPRGQASTACC